MAYSKAGNNPFTNLSPVPTLNHDHKYGITTKVYHGAVIKAGIGNNASVTVGRIQSWQPTQYSRAGSTVREVHNKTWGRPVDYVPGIVEDHTLVFTRVEVWNEELELALGFNGGQGAGKSLFIDLADQTQPFTITEILHRGNSEARKWAYYGCWFTERNENEYAADGDGKVVVNATVAYVWRNREK